MDLKHHDRFMKRAMTLAERGRGFVSPNPVVGAVLVRKGKIIAEDWHRKFGEGHAERNLLEGATIGKQGTIETMGKKSRKDHVHEDDVLYVTLEPCCHTNKKTSPCTDIILESGVRKVVVGLLDPNPEVSGKGVAMLRRKGVEVVVMLDESGIWNLESWRNSRFKIQDSKFRSVFSELVWQNRFFFKWVRKGLPWVTLKMAQSLDGRIGKDRGQQLWLTGKESIAHVHQMRAQYDAILVGVKTVIADNPMLTVRDAPLRPLTTFKGNRPTRASLNKQPTAVILDAALSTPLTSNVVRPGTLIFCGRQFRRRKGRKEQLTDKGCIVLEADTDAQGFLNLREILAELAARGIASLYVEGGSTIWSSFIREGLADELMVYYAPKFLGDGVTTLDFEGESLKLKFREMKVLGADIFVNYEF